LTTYYFAARYSRNAEMRRYRNELAALIPDAKVTSRWIDQHGGTLLNSVVVRELDRLEPAARQRAIVWLSSRYAGETFR
jgi:hypothetical protein